MNFTNTTIEDDLLEDDSTTVMIVIVVMVVLIFLCYFCNRNEAQDRADIEARTSRTQVRISIRGY